MKIAVIGGGASGQAAAISAARAGAQVSIFERNALLGKKILLTGNGRCNLSNLRLDPSRYEGSAKKLAGAALAHFSVKDTIRFFEDIGIPVIEAASARGDESWLYPRVREAAAVRGALDMACAEAGVGIMLNTYISDIRKTEKGFCLFSEDNSFFADRVILAGGGCAAPKSGSDGSAYALAEKMGHHPVKPLPALGALCSSSEILGRISGQRVIAQIRLVIDRKIRATESGEVQFTAYGLSGIPVFQMSALAARALDENKKVSLVLDFCPESGEKDVFAELIRRRSLFGRQESGRLMTGLIPDKLIPPFLKLAGIPLHIPVKTIRDDSLKKLSCLLKELSFSINGSRGFEDCQVSSGGIPAEEISETLESRICPGLFFCGEIIDIDGPCGGYNLQWAWSSGFLAGAGAAKKGEEHAE